MINQLKNHLQSKFFRGVVCALAIFIIILIIFQVGRFVGFHQAGFSYRMGDNYYRAFEGPRRNLMPKGFPLGDLPASHGAVGKIIKVSLPSIIISTSDGLEKTVLITEDTEIKLLRNSASTTDLKIDSMVVIIGDPNDQSQIEAKLIRLLPAPIKK